MVGIGIQERLASLPPNAIETLSLRDNLHVAKLLHTVAVRTSTRTSTRVSTGTGTRARTRIRSLTGPSIPAAHTSIARLPPPALRPLVPNTLHSRRNQTPHLIFRARNRSATTAATIPLPLLLKPTLLQPRRRRQKESPENAHHRRRVLPHVHRQLAEAEGHEEADQLVVLVQVVLRFDVEFPAVGRAREVQLGGEGDVGVVEGDHPEGDGLGYVEVED